MRVREFALGIAPFWGLAPLVMSFAVSGPIDQWDMSVDAAVGLLIGLAVAFAVAGAIIWIPAAVWLARASRYAPIARLDGHESAPGRVEGLQGWAGSRASCQLGVRVRADAIRLTAAPKMLVAQARAHPSLRSTLRRPSKCRSRSVK